MTGELSTTGPLVLKKALDSDDRYDYLVTELNTNIDNLNAALDTTTGHDHDGTDSAKVNGANLVAGSVPVAALDADVLTTAESALSGNDTTHTAGVWNDIGVSVSLAAGTWLVMAALNGRAVTTSGDRYGRIRNTTDGTDVSVGSANATDAWNFSITPPPRVLVLAGTKTITLEYYARNVGDYVYGSAGALGTPGSSLVAVKIG